MPNLVALPAHGAPCPQGSCATAAPTRREPPSPANNGLALLRPNGGALESQFRADPLAPPASIVVGSRSLGIDNGNAIRDEGRTVEAGLGRERRRAGAGFGGAADEQDRYGSIILKRLNWRAVTRAHPAYPRRYTPHRSFPYEAYSRQCPPRPEGHQAEVRAYFLYRQNCAAV